MHDAREAAGTRVINIMAMAMAIAPRDALDSFGGDGNRLSCHSCHSKFLRAEEGERERAGACTFLEAVKRAGSAMFHLQWNADLSGSPPYEQSTRCSEKRPGT